MKFTNLTESYRLFLSGSQITDKSCKAFLTQLQYLEKNISEIRPNKNMIEARLSRLKWADQCAQIFLLPHSASHNVSLVGAIMASKIENQSVEEVIHAGGRGMNLLSAFEGCMDELAECHAMQNWQVVPAQNEDPKFDLHLPDDAAGTTAISFINATRWGDQKSVALPFHIASPYFSTSNGCACGETLSIAIERAAFELVERDAVAKWWFSKSSAPAASAEHTAELSRVFPPGSDITRHRWLLDLTTANGIPVIAALSCASNGTGLVLGAAAGKDRTSSALRASLELCQMEAAASISLKKQAEFGDASLSELDKLWIRRICSPPVPHARPDTASSAPSNNIHYIQSVIAKIGQAYLIDLSPKDANYSVARLICPQMTSINILKARASSGVLADGNQIQTIMDEFPTPM